MYKVDNNMFMTAFQDTWKRTHVRNNRELRNANDFDLPIARLSTYESHPFFKFVELWKNLPAVYKKVKSFSEFKTKIKAKLFSEIPN